ncbi:hypothetical protein ACLI4Z_18020 [Natrialbaceae archaeon A-arb3/5]
MAYGQRDSDALTDRNSDRVRILKFLVRHPEGILRTHLTHYVLKGTRSDTYDGFVDLRPHPVLFPKPEEHHYDRHHPSADRGWHNNDWIALDGSDDDYQFCKRFTNDLAEKADLVRLEYASAGVRVYPTTSAIDLISEGIRETPAEQNEFVYDREFVQNMLKTCRGDAFNLSTSQKEFAARALRRYIHRTQDYRLLFDVHLANRSGYDRRRMEKSYKTRFTDEGRVNKAFARLQSALEYGYEHAENAVFVTLTTDPSQHESLWHAIQSINPNFHNLTQFFKTDPSTVKDTRNTDVPYWRFALDSSNFHFGQEGAVSGRPRERLEYVKVLEFDSGGKPHLHCLFFDVPTRESDGMPWLVDKDELSHYWDRYGQGRIVDTYPLTYRDDLDELGDFGDRVLRDEDGTRLTDENGEFVTKPVQEGFVSWYRYGDHDHSQEWVDNHVRYHKSSDGLIDMDGDDDFAREKTAGAYIGKYITEMYGALLDHNETDLEHEFDPDLDANDDDAAFWKLALYWATERQFWSPSNGIRDAIRLDDDRADIRRGVADATKTALLVSAEKHHEPHASYPDLDLERSETMLHRVVRDLLAERELAETEASTSSTTLARIEYLGAFHYADTPDSGERRVDAAVVEQAIYDPDEPVALASTGDRPPPSADVWD